MGCSAKESLWLVKTGAESHRNTSWSCQAEQSLSSPGRVRTLQRTGIVCTHEASAVRLR